MFISSWPWWANALILAAIPVLKWFAIKYVEKSSWFTKLSAGKSWMATANITALLNAAVTFAILFLPAGLIWAFLLGILDGVVHWLIAYWQRKKALPTVSAGNISTAEAWWTDIKSWFSALPLSTYLSIGGWVASETLTGSTTFSSAFNLLLTFIKSKL
jgi:hypothetical protein